MGGGAGDRLLEEAGGGLLEELRGEDLHPEVRRFYEKVVRGAPDQYFRLLSAARTWERSRRGREGLARAMRELL